MNDVEDYAHGERDRERELEAVRWGNTADLKLETWSE